MKTRSYKLKGGQERAVVLDHVGVVNHACYRFCLTSCHVMLVRPNGTGGTLCGADRRGRARYSAWCWHEADVDAVLQMHQQAVATDYAHHLSGRKLAGHDICVRCAAFLEHLDLIARGERTGNPAIWYREEPPEEYWHEEDEWDTMLAHGFWPERYTKKHPCPICGGHAELAGKGCDGWLDKDGIHAYCSRVPSPVKGGELDA